MPNWYYESDGGYRGPVTHYLTNEDNDRIDFESKEDALGALTGINDENSHS